MNRFKSWLYERMRSFPPALNGIRDGYRTTPNAKIHLFFTIAAVVAAIVLRLNPGEWAILALTIGVVWSAELMNCAVEAIVDLVTPERSPIAKLAKDTAAGAVLVAAIVSVIVGLCLFGPKLLAWLPGE